MSHSIRLSDEVLELLGVSRKDFDIYLCLLRLGTAPLRRLAEEAGLNRGTAYDALKRLMAAGLASYVDARTHRYFAAQDPTALRGLATRREVALREARTDLDGLLPSIEALRGQSGHRPAVRYYEGDSGVRDLLEDVLATAERSHEKSYRVYSSAGIRDLIAGAWPGFTKERIRRGVRVRAVAVGTGGTTAGLDQRKWLTDAVQAPTYIFVYPGKTAYVAVDASKKLFGAVIEDAAVSATQALIFDALWKALP
ncbi:hypothetical protein HY734_02665 [Candidatus Uhrbacteria bacterium]|nr:hypothetical protein [Candidatus Uhrbacteria bacterium]